jgi:hypothetical protein
VGDRNPGVRHLKVQQVVKVREPQAASIPRILAWKLRVKAYIGPLLVVEELAVNGQLGLGPDVLQKQALAPTMVSDDHIRCEAHFLHLQRCTEALLAPYSLGLKVRNPSVSTGRGSPVFCMVMATTV